MHESMATNGMHRVRMRITSLLPACEEPSPPPRCSCWYASFFFSCLISSSSCWILKAFSRDEAVGASTDPESRGEAREGAVPIAIVMPCCHASRMSHQRAGSRSRESTKLQFTSCGATNVRSTSEHASSATTAATAQRLIRGSSLSDRCKTNSAKIYERFCNMPQVLFLLQVSSRSH